MKTHLGIALKALGRNKLQTVLTMLGMTIGVAAVLTMIALGSGAQGAIEDQVRAAGMNLIIVTAGNYKPAQEGSEGQAVEPSAWHPDRRSTQRPQSAQKPYLYSAGSASSAFDGSRATQRPQNTQKPYWYSASSAGSAFDGPRSTQRPQSAQRILKADLRDSVGSESPVFDAVPATWDPRQPVPFALVMHPEDDPMEKHDHPTAAQRLGDLEAGLGGAATLTSADADAIRQIPGVQYVAEGVHQNSHVEYGDKKWFTRLNGTDIELPQIRRAWTFTHGRFFTLREEKAFAQAIVLGNVVAQKLFGDADPVGKQVRIWNQPFQVVGVINSTSMLVAPAPGDNQFDAVYVPFTTVHRLLNLSKLNDIEITAASTGDVTRLSQHITSLLRNRHHISERMPDDFTVTTQARQALGRGGMRPDVARAVVGNVQGLEKVTLEQLAKTLDRASRTMTALLASIAGVSLLVGGIGIMNIMLLSVTERTREIGIRRAVGARSKDVLMQFLTEAVVLSLAGGVVGIAIGLLASDSISQFMKWSTSMSGGAVAIAFGVAAAVGIFFGWYPARQAARLDPIDSLRYE